MTHSLDCQNGTYTELPGQLNCTSCPIMHYCPSGFPAPIQCPRGYINLETGKEFVNHCSFVNENVVCDELGILSDNIFVMVSHSKKVTNWF